MAQPGGRIPAPGSAAYSIHTVRTPSQKVTPPIYTVQIMRLGLCVVLGIALLGCGDDSMSATGGTGGVIDAALHDASAPDAPAPDAPCAGTMCGAACVDLQTDPMHCGACGSVCAGTCT